MKYFVFFVLFLELTFSLSAISSSELFEEAVVALETHRAQQLSSREKSALWTIQESLENSYRQFNHINLIQQWKRIKNLILDESLWKAISDELRTSDRPFPHHWQDWYKRWVKWERQSTYREAVLSGLIFPQSVLVESKYFDTESHPLIRYGFALSSLNNHPEGYLRLWKAREAFYDPEEEGFPFLSNLFEKDLSDSENDLAKELWAFYPPLPHELVTFVDMLDALKDTSILAQEKFGFQMLSKDSEKAREILSSVRRAGGCPKDGPCIFFPEEYYGEGVGSLTKETYKIIERYEEALPS